LESSREGRPPFAFLFRYVGSWYGAVDWEQAQQADAYLREPVARDLGLPIEMEVRHVETSNFRLFPSSEAAYEDVNNPLDWVRVGFVSDLADHITLLEGRFPESSHPLVSGQVSADDPPMEVLLHHSMVDDLGLQVGEEYVLFGDQESNAVESKLVEIPVRIAGVWQPTNPEEDYWFYKPNTLDRTLIIPEESYHQRLVPLLKGEVYLSVWYLLLDGSGVFTEDVVPFLNRLASVNARIESLLPNSSLDISPDKAMQEFRQDAGLLTILLSVFAIPVLGLILYFVSMIAGMAVRRQQTEIAVLRSRGMSRGQVMGVYLLEGLTLSTVALVLGVALGYLIALIMGQIRSFLTLVNRPPLLINLSWGSMRFAFVAIGLAMLTTLLPALSAASHTVVTHKQEQARSLRRPFWQRYFLDFFLLAPPLYGYYLLRQRGTISVNLGTGVTSDPFQNPLLFLVPTFFIFALGLIFIRIFPLLMSALSWFAGKLPGVAPVLALRHLARSWQQYTGPLLLLILTLGLAAFTASMALTLDDHLVDQVYYEVGSDVHLTEYGESTEQSTNPFAFAAQQQDETAEEEVINEGPKWLFLPVAQHLDASGVLAAARVGKYRAVSTLGNREEGIFVGLDRVDFANVGFFRKDFASDSLGGLMNRLALDPRAILVERDFLARNAIGIGDTLRLNMSMTGEQKTVDFVVAGSIDLFPTEYPEGSPFFVGNLDYAFQQMGDEFPYDVWLSTDTNQPIEVTVDELEGMGFKILGYQDSRQMILKEQTQPSRQGLFGMLSVGFLAAAGLTVLGFLLYAIFSFRQRFIQLGVLQAIGLSVGQMVAFLAGEQLALILTGAVAGTGLGVWASYLFIPFLQVRAGIRSQTPPFVVQIAWADIDRIYAVFSGMLLVGVIVMAILLVRMRVFEAIKLGEVA
jgi:putative ABC transport system permease protein